MANDRGTYGHNGVSRESVASLRGTYGVSRLGADPHGQRGSSIGTWIIGGLVVGGAVLWAKHQSDQVEKLYAQAGLPHQSFVEGLRERSKELSGAAREKIHGLTQRFRTKKELQHGT
jgi:hypothetical protein